MKKTALLLLLSTVFASSRIFSVSPAAERWALIEDVHGDRLKVETVSDEVWAQLVQLYYNGGERWIGGTVERYDNEWGFRFDPKTIIVAEVTIEVLQTTIRHISENLDYWLGKTAVVGARVIQVHQPPPVGGVWVRPNKLELLAPWIGLSAVIVLSLVATVVFSSDLGKRNSEFCALSLVFVSNIFVISEKKSISPIVI